MDPFLDDFDLDVLSPPRRRRKKRDDDFLDEIWGDEPSPAELRAMEAEMRRTVTPEEESSILGDIGGAALSGLGWVGEVFDKYSGDRAIRGALAGKPRELLSIIPFSDDLGITNHDDLTTGEDLNQQWFGLAKDNSWTAMGAGMGTEIGLGLLNPLSWIGTAADALTGAGKVAKASGLYDDLVRVANAKELTEAGKAGRAARTIGGFEGQMTTTLDDLINHFGSRTPEEISSARKLAEDSAKAMNLNLDDILHEPLGHRLGVKDWTGETIGALPGFAAGDDLGLMAARASDTVADTLFGKLPDWVPGIGGKAPLVGLRSLFDPYVDNAVTREGQDAISPRINASWAKEGGDNLDAMETLTLAQEAGIEPDELRDMLAGSGQYFTGRRAPDAQPKPWHMTNEQFEAAKQKALYGARPLRYGLDTLMQGADDTVAEAIEKFRETGDYADLVGAQRAAGLPAMPETEFKTRTEALMQGLGPLAEDYAEVVKKNIDDATQAAVASAEGLQPGHVAKLRKWGTGKPYEALQQNHPALYEALKRERKALDNWGDKLAAEGRPLRFNVDAEEMFYAPRYLMDAGKLADDIARDIDLKHFPGGTSALKNMLKDVAEKGAGDAKQMQRVLANDYADAIMKQVQNEAEMSGTTLGPDGLITKVTERIEGIAKSLAAVTPEQRAAGLFGNHVTLDTRSYKKMMNGTLANLQAGNDALGSYLGGILDGKWNLKTTPNKGVKLGDVLDNFKVDLGTKDGKTGWIKAMAKRLGFELPDSINGYDALRKRLRDIDIPEDLARDLLRVDNVWETPRNVQGVVDIFDSLTTLFKSFTLAHPATKVRDFYAGQLHSSFMGNWSHDTFSEVGGLLQGQTSDFWKQFRPVQEILERQGINPASATAEQATEAARTLAGSMDRMIQGQTSELMRKGGASAQELLDARPGVKPKTFMGAGEDAISEYDGLSSWFQVEGVFGAEKTRNPAVRASNYLGEWTDRYNRLVPFFELLRQGYSPSAAEARVMLQQVDYSHKALGKFEQSWLSKIFPFYKFTRGMAKQLAQELWERPRGRMSNVIKGQAILARQDDEEFVPGHIRQTMAIPLGQGDGKYKSYLTGLGLMHEDVFGLARPGVNTFDTVQGLLQELAGRAHPFLKAPAEITSGTQLYSGRDLRDLEGGLGRAMGNVLGMEDAVEIPILAEEAVSMSPFSRGVSTVRTLFDPRKDAIQKMLNLTTGMRTDTVDMERARQVEVRKALEAMLRGKPGIQAMENLYQSEGAVLSPHDDAMMRFLRKHNYEQQKLKQKPKQQRDELEELLSL